MTEEEAMNKIKALVIGRRKYLGISDHSYCSKCQKIDARYLTCSVVDGSTECEECFIKRKYDELITQIEEIKKERAQTVRDYFASRSRYFKSRKCSETFTEKSHQFNR